VAAERLAAVQRAELVERHAIGRHEYQRHVVVFGREFE
jgi:hypothetical protein